MSAVMRSAQRRLRALTAHIAERFTPPQMQSPIVLVLAGVVLIETTGERSGG